MLKVRKNLIYCIYENYADLLDGTKRWCDQPEYQGGVEVCGIPLDVMGSQLFNVAKTI